MESSQSFESVLFGDLPSLLYHYTTPSGLVGILESRSLWLTDVHHLNDTTEFMKASDVVTRRIKATGKSSLSKVEGDALAAFETILDEPFDAAVACFCEHGDLLGQWRGYAASRGGYSIGFDSLHLFATATSQHCGLIRCVYKAAEQSRLAETILEEWVATVLSATEGGKQLTDEFRPEVEHLVRRFNQLAASAKDPSFEDEHEWRVVRLNPGGAMAFRATESLVIPYTHLELTNDEGSLGIKEIVVGPTPHPERSKQTIERLLRSHGVEGCRVRATESPFRNW